MEVSMNHEEYPLNVATPRSFTYVTRDIPRVTAAQRERALKATHYNEFAFPAGMLTVDMLSDSGTTAMTDVQWSATFLGSRRLCGGIFVAIPTAIPCAPFTSKFG